METSPPPIPDRFTCERTVNFWGTDYQVTPAAADSYHGDGRLLMAFQPLNTRPNYYLIRADSSFGDDENDDTIDEIIDLLQDDFSDQDSERGYLADDLADQGIEPDGDNTDLAGNEDRLGWPVLSLDSGYCWWEKARFVDGEWVD